MADAGSASDEVHVGVVVDAADSGSRSKFERTWRDPTTGVAGWFATVNNNPLGARYMVTALVFFLIAGVMALFIRTQLIIPENTFLDPQTYNQLFTMHGSTMMFLFVVPFLEGLANFILPQLLGSRDLAYPRVTAFGYWLYLFGGTIFLASFLVNAVPDAGWFAYTPLSDIDFAGLGMDFYLLGLGAIELGGIATGIELTVSILKLRSPGMTLGRMPLFAWALLVMALAIIVAFTVLLVATLFLELDRAAGTRFFDPTGGGNPLLWQHMFWIFGHPEVYIMFIPATGIVSMIIPTFARRPLTAYLLVVLALIVTGFVSFALWAHHMFTTGLPLIAASFFTAASFMIAIASGTQIFAWIATLWRSRPRFTTPLLFTFGFIVIFMLGGVTGVMVASLPLDAQVHDTHFVVAHFHYVLVGGVVFPIFAGLYYWMPLLAGKVLNERLGHWNFWLTFVGFNVTFFPMHISGLLGMPRRVYTYQDGLGLGAYNLVSTAGSYLLAVGFALFFINFLLSMRSQAKSAENPWGAGTLEWAVPVPSPNYNFAAPPIIEGRYPLWDDSDDELRVRDRHELSYVEALRDLPDHHRATLVTSVVEGEPQGLWNLSGPSYIPVLTALSVTVVAVGPLVGAYWLMGLGALGAVAALVYWLWPTPAERERLLHQPLNESLNLPLEGRGSREAGWWGIVLFLVAVGVAYGICLFAYFYLKLYSSVWPQGGIDLPTVTLPAVAAGLLLLSIAPIVAGSRAIRQGDQRGLRVGLALALLLGLVFSGLHVYHFVDLGFVPQENAYASIYYFLAGLTAFTTLLALALTAAALIRAMKRHFDAKFNVAVQHTAMVWNVMAVANVVTLAVIQLTPHWG
ncbi:MAG TPA: cytochrome c oxidase subunit I [Trueperaceae bacterium]|nr:cytochrome c oxidase subunit I [Trueperaceae bacterium]